ncbi:MAG: hypothetical protein JO160_07105 [Candidatus Eremiobacteraeota bacterium]|nr:hypothetical protein [Candidatus Eremiobacteraeota bacterium]MBV8655800.1 hypothetical protein [Candidatus Eremiobacteraeota bacterium]
MSTQTLEARMSRVEGILEQVDKRLDNIDRRLEGFDARFNWVIGTIVGTWITTILAILFHR